MMLKKAKKYNFKEKNMLTIMPWSLKNAPNKNYTNTICMFEVHLTNKMHRKSFFIF